MDITQTPRRRYRFVIGLAMLVALAAGCTPHSSGPVDPFPSGLPDDEQLFDPGDCTPPYVLIQLSLENDLRTPTFRSGTIAVTGFDRQGSLIYVRDRKTGVITPFGTTIIFKAQEHVDICLEYGLAITLAQLNLVIRVTNTKKGDYYILDSELGSLPGQELPALPDDYWRPEGGPWQTSVNLILG